MKVVIIEGAELASLLAELDAVRESREVYALRLVAHGDQVMVKVNGGMWSATIGKVEQE